jgi:hypothetical protein
MAARRQAKTVKTPEVSPLVGKHVRILFGQHYRQQGRVTTVFPRDAVRKQDMAMIKLNDGRIVSGVPVKDLQVTA